MIMKTELLLALALIFIDVLWMCSFLMTLARMVEKNMHHVDFWLFRYWNRFYIATYDYLMCGIHFSLILYLIWFIIDKIVTFVSIQILINSGYFI